MKIKLRKKISFYYIIGGEYLDALCVEKMNELFKIAPDTYYLVLDVRFKNPKKKGFKKVVFSYSYDRLAYICFTSIGKLSLITSVASSIRRMMKGADKFEAWIKATPSDYEN